MSYKPMKPLSEKHVNGLGFVLTNKTRKDSTIVLKVKEEDLRVKLILAHYSMHLMPAFLMEGCLSIYLKNELIENGDYKDGMAVAMRPCYAIMKFYKDLFKNETFLSNDLTKERMLESVGFFVKKGLMQIKGDDVIVVNKEGIMTLIDFFSNLIHPLIDTYLVTLTAISEMCGKNLVVKNKKLTKELHTSLKLLY